jgi:hypothetical protein
MGDLGARAWRGPRGLFEEYEAKSSNSGLLVNLSGMFIRTIEGSSAVSAGSKEGLLAECNETTSQVDHFYLTDQKGNWYNCLPGENWHASPAAVDTSEEVAILLAYPESHVRIEAPKKTLDAEWYEDGLLVTYKPMSVLGSGPIPARAHRHVILMKAGIKHAEFENKLWTCVEQARNQYLRVEQNATLDDDRLDTYVKRELEATVRSKPGFLELGKQYHESYNMESSDEVVIEVCVSRVRDFVRRWPWCAVQKMSEKIMWCID